MEVKEQIENFLKRRPDTVCTYGYGSGVFKQAGYTDEDKPQIDLILAVKDIKKWHLENIKMNPSDYSIIGKIFYSNASRETIKGFNGIAYQSNIRDYTWYLALNSRYSDGAETEMECKVQMFKYGVIEYSDLEKQLKTWNRFYLAGRFQKGILPIKSTKEIDSLIEENRKDALVAALYFLGKESTLTELYETIVSLSYIGDTRMKFFENPNKIRNIVSKLKDELDYIYKKKNPYFEIVDDEKIIVNHQILNKEFLPASLAYYLSGIPKDNLEAMRQAIYNFFKEKNKKESLNQTIHGIKTNGIVNSSDYVFQKIKKRIYKK
mgnify:CR=1 FL=1